MEKASSWCANGTDSEVQLHHQHRMVAAVVGNDLWDPLLDQTIMSVSEGGFSPATCSSWHRLTDLHFAC